MGTYIVFKIFSKLCTFIWEQFKSINHINNSQNNKPKKKLMEHVQLKIEMKILTMIVRVDAANSWNRISRTGDGK